MASSRARSCVIAVLDGLHAGGDGGFDVVLTVVDEEDMGGVGLEAFGGVDVDGGFGLGEIEGVGPGAVVEGARASRIWRQMPSAMASPMLERMPVRKPVRWRRCGPVDHGGVELCPEIDVGDDEVGKLCRR